MKVFRKLALGLLFIVAASLNGATTVMAQSRMYGSSYNSFYDDLAPHGRWVMNRQYGEVWIPNVERGFQPYATRGHWVMTEYGNTWVSDYDWGWAPFHYGRWTFDDYYGWIWIPGNEWGPAWVSWRSDNDYYGWAPLGPGVDINININIPLARWIFVPRRHFMTRNVYDYCVPRQRMVNVYHNTTVINNIYVNGNRRYVSGPYRADIERSTRQRVNVYRVDNNDRPSRTVERDGSLRVYRPESIDRPNRSSRGDGRIEDYRNGRDRYDRNYGNTRDSRSDYNGRVDNRNNDPGRDRSSPNAGNSRQDNDGRTYDRGNSPGRDYSQDRDRTQQERYSRQQDDRMRGNSGNTNPSGSYGREQRNGSSERPSSRPDRTQNPSNNGEQRGSSSGSPGNSRGGTENTSGGSRPIRG